MLESNGEDEMVTWCKVGGCSWVGGRVGGTGRLSGKGGKAW